MAKELAEKMLGELVDRTFAGWDFGSGDYNVISLVRCMPDGSLKIEAISERQFYASADDVVEMTEDEVTGVWRAPTLPS